MPYGVTAVVTDIEASFPPGTLTAVVGPNGCGKSTLVLTELDATIADAATTLEEAGLDGTPIALSQDEG